VPLVHVLVVVERIVLDEVGELFLRVCWDVLELAVVCIGVERRGQWLPGKGNLLLFY
jgi:hypothetical protein